MTRRVLSVEWHRKLIDKLAYASLVLDICIASITLFTIFKIGDPAFFLMPVNYLLTVVVILSCISAILIIILRSQETVLRKIKTYHYKPRRKFFR